MAALDRILIDFKHFREGVQVYADKNCGGNFNAAVRKLIAIGLFQSNKKGKK